MATSFMRPPHFGHASPSSAKGRARSSAHGRYPGVRFGFDGAWGAAGSVVSPVSVVGFGRGPMQEPLVREGWTKHVAEKRLTADDIQRASLRRGVKREAIERRAQRLVVSERFWRERRETLKPLRSCGRRLARYSGCGEASLEGVAGVLGEPYVERPVVNGAIERLDVTADNLIEGRRLRPAALVSGARSMLRGAFRG